MKKNRIFKFLLVVLIMSLVIIGCGKKNKEEAPKTNTNDGIVDDQVVGDLVFKKTALVYEKGTSKLTTQVTNNSNEVKHVGSFDIIFKDEKGNEIVKILGYIGSNLNPKESRTLTSLVDQNLLNAVSVEYIEK